MCGTPAGVRRAGPMTQKVDWRTQQTVPSWHSLSSGAGCRAARRLCLGYREGMRRTRGVPEFLAPPPSTRWQGGADRLAHLAWLVLLLAIAIGLVGGVIVAAVAPSRPAAVAARDDPCPDPPCFDFGSGLPGAADIPMVVTELCYLVAVVLSVPSALAAAWDGLHRRWAAAGRRLLTFIGPVLVVAGTEILPHVLPVCAVLPQVCEELDRGGRDVANRWHQLDHTLLGAVPMAFLYWVALRRWRPTLVQLP